MKVLLPLLFLAAFVVGSRAQTSKSDSASHEKVMIGAVGRAAIDSTSWYKSNRELYRPTSKLIGQIDSLGSGDSVVVVFGSWCPDSHIWVPIFLNIADSSTLGKNIRFVAVPRSKEEQQKLTRGLDIEKVPTFIFYRNGKELGRIVESPNGDIGDNIIDILKGDK
ncbi:MAG: thioredoxin family protein [Bacteroidetes bacterium]|nr:thioredoxin family protein [Bacteroidota bacterium]